MKNVVEKQKQKIPLKITLETWSLDSGLLMSNNV